jgi:phosphoribosylamine--glycine ligase
MKDDEGTGMDLCMRAKDYGHEVQYWTDGLHPAGVGLVERPYECGPALQWADLIVLTGNCDYPDEVVEAFEQGLPIFGTNPKAAELELDRAAGQQVLDDCGIETIPYYVVDSAEEGIEFISAADQPFVLKPWGGNSDKAMTFVAKTPEDAIFTLQKWQREGTFRGQLMLQEKVEGVEIGVSAFFSSGGWSKPIEESFEHKKFMNDDLGPNCGEQGTVIRHVRESKLFSLLLEPLTDYLHSVKFVGDCSINCIVDATGTPYPLEFTVRTGWPDFCIRQEVIQGDPVEWIWDLVYGRDTLQVSPAIALGIVMTHGDYPREDDPPSVWSGYPITFNDESSQHLHWQQVMKGFAPQLTEGRVGRAGVIVTAGQYPLVVTGSGATVEEAQIEAYKVAWEVDWPSGVMFRTDIGKRLEADLLKLHEHGYALGMGY